MTDFKVFKKEFQKAVKAYRDTLPNATRLGLAGGTREVRPEYPKAMLTAKQAEKRTATVKLGQWGNYSDKLNKRVEDLMAFIPFRDWCYQYGVTVCGVERDSWGGASLRLRF